MAEPEGGLPGGSERQEWADFLLFLDTTRFLTPRRVYSVIADGPGWRETLGGIGPTQAKSAMTSLLRHACEVIDRECRGYPGVELAQLAPGFSFGGAGCDKPSPADNTIVARMAASQAVARRAYAPIWAQHEARLTPMEGLLKFHQFGPGLSVYAVLHELVNTIICNPDTMSLLEPRWGEWEAPRRLADEMEERFHFLLDLWPDPNDANRDGTDLTLEQQRAYLLALLLAGRSQLEAHDPNGRLGPTNLSQVRSLYADFVEQLIEPGRLALDTGELDWSTRLLLCIDLLGKEIEVVREPADRYDTVRTAKALIRARRDNWIQWRRVAARQWPIETRLNLVPPFGITSISELSLQLQKQAGLHGPAYLLARRDGLGHQHFPHYSGGSYLENWASTIVKNWILDWRRRVPDEWRLLAKQPADLEPQQIAHVHDIWLSIGGRLAAGYWELEIDETRADLIRTDLERYCQRLYSFLVSLYPVEQRSYSDFRQYCREYAELHGRFCNLVGSTWPEHVWKGIERNEQRKNERGKNERTKVDNRNQHDPYDDYLLAEAKRQFIKSLNLIHGEYSASDGQTDDAQGDEDGDPREQMLADPTSPPAGRHYPTKWEGTVMPEDDQDFPCLKAYALACRSVVSEITTWADANPAVEAIYEEIFARSVDYGWITKTAPRRPEQRNRASRLTDCVEAMVEPVTTAPRGVVDSVEHLLDVINRGAESGVYWNTCLETLFSALARVFSELRTTNDRLLRGMPKALAALDEWTIELVPPRNGDDLLYLTEYIAQE